MNNKFVNTLVRGFSIIIPLLAIAYLFEKLYKTVAEQVQKILENTVLQSTLQIVGVVILSLIIIILITYTIGAISRHSKVVEWANSLDEWMINNISVYRNIKLQIDNNSQFVIEDKPPIFVKFGQYERPGFLIEKKPEFGKYVVFIPKNFNTYNGNIYIVPIENVRIANSDKDSFVVAMDRLGKGLDIS